MSESPTFPEFVAECESALYRPDIDSALARGDAYTLLFALRYRVPNRMGLYGPDAEGASWAKPEDWHRRYYEARYPEAAHPHTPKP